MRVRKRKTSKKTDHAIGRAVVGSPGKMCNSIVAIAEDLKNLGINISDQAIRHRLAEQGLHGCIDDAKKTLLRSKNINKILKLARTHAHWTASY